MPRKPDIERLLKKPYLKGKEVARLMIMDGIEKDLKHKPGFLNDKQKDLLYVKVNRNPDRKQFSIFNRIIEAHKMWGQLRNTTFYHYASICYYLADTSDVNFFLTFLNELVPIIMKINPKDKESKTIKNKTIAFIAKAKKTTSINTETKLRYETKNTKISFLYSEILAYKFVFKELSKYLRVDLYSFIDILLKGLNKNIIIYNDIIKTFNDLSITDLKIDLLHCGTEPTKNQIDVIRNKFAIVLGDKWYG